jgi:HTH-type transcriptional regulator / antitoxin HigA
MEADLIEDSPEEIELRDLSIFVEAYEKEHYHVPPPHPIEAIKFHLDQMGIN